MKPKAFNVTPYKRELVPRSRELRREMTPQERRLWYDYLRNYPIKFYRQKTIDRCIADFYCSQAKLVIEVDGSQHLTEDGLVYDQERTDILTSSGISVLRFTNLQIEQQFNTVCREIDRAVQERILQKQNL